MKSIENIYLKIYSTMGKNKIISSIRQGCIMTMPIFIMGAFALLFMFFPIPMGEIYIHIC